MRGGGLDGPGAAVVHQQGRRMPATEHGGVVGGGRDLHDDGGGEAFAVVLRGHRGGVSGDGALQALREVRQVGGVVGRFVEGAEERGRDADGGQALAADVPEDEAQTVGRVGRGVEVAADAGLGRRGEVEGGDLQIPDALRHRPEKDLLCRVGDGADLGEGVLALQAQMAGVGRGQADGADRARGVQGGHVGEGQGVADHREQADHPEGERRPHGPDRRGERGRRRQQPGEGDVLGVRTARTPMTAVRTAGVSRTGSRRRRFDHIV